MSSSGVNIPVGVDDNASKPIDRIRDRFDTLGTSKGIQSMVTGFGMGAGIQVFNLAKQALSGVADAITGAIEASAGEAESVGRLQKTLDNATPAWRENAKAIDERINAGMKLAFSDDAMRDSLGSLAARTHDVTKALDLQKIAMDLARAKGLDLTTAANLVGKVYNGNIGILSRYGIAVDKGSTSTQALAAIQKMASGQAEQYGKSTKGSAESLGVAFGEIAESVGDALMPVLQELIPILRDSVMPIIATLAQLFGLLLRALSPVISFVANIAVQAFKVLAQVALEVGGAIVAVAAAIPGPWQDGAKAMQGAIDDMKANLGKMTVFASDVAGDVGPNAGAALAGGAADIGEGADEAFGPLDGEAAAHAKQAEANVGKSLREIVADIKSAKSEFLGAWKDAMDESTREEEIAVELSANAAERREIEHALHSHNMTTEERKTAQERLAELKRGDADLLIEQTQYGTLAQREARLGGLLNGQAIVQGMKDADPDVAKMWTDVRNRTAEALRTIQGDMGKAGLDNAREWAGALGGKDALKSAVIAANALVGGAYPLQQSGWAYTSGYNVGVAWANGLWDTNSWLYKQVIRWLRVGKGPLESGSPPKEGPFHQVDVWGRKIGETWAENLGKGLGSVGDVVAKLDVPAALTGRGAPAGASPIGPSGGDVNVFIDTFYGDSGGIQALSREIGWQVRLQTAKAAI